MAKYLPAACSAALSILATASAQATDIIISDAKVAGGKLVITGTTEAPGTWVRLDGQTDQSFNVKSDTERNFAFGIVYHPGDCIVDLQRLISPTALGTATRRLSPTADRPEFRRVAPGSPAPGMCRTTW